MTRGEMIRAARKRRFWSQENLAKHAGLSYRTIHVAEADGPVRDKTLKAIADALEIDPHSLVEEEVAS